MPMETRPCRFLPLVGALLLVSSSFAQTLDAKTKEDVLKRMGRIVTERAFASGADFSKWPSFVSEYQADIDKAGTADQFTDAINAALRKFGFSHIMLHTPKQAQTRVERKTVGIGVRIFPHEDGLLIVDVIEGGPAKEAGIEPQDVMVKVDGKKLESTEQVAGEEGTKVVITVKKPDGKEKDFTITRRKFSTVVPEKLEWPAPDTAVLTIPTFDMSYDSKRVDRLFDEIQEKKARNLVLDLRSNGGGAVLNMLHLLNHILPGGTEVGAFVNKDQVEAFAEETKGDPKDIVAVAKWVPGKLKTWETDRPVFTGPKAVLVNGGSGSASEIVAAALKEKANAPVIGSRSAGAVLASFIVPLVHGFQLQYPVTDYVSIGGLRIEGNGVKVDYEAPSPRPFEKDQGIEKALEVLRTVVGKGVS